MTRALLLLLFDDRDYARAKTAFQDPRHLLLLVAEHRHDRGGADGTRPLDGIGRHGHAQERVQHLVPGRVHAGALARGQD